MLKKELEIAQNSYDLAVALRKRGFGIRKTGTKKPCRIMRQLRPTITDTSVLAQAGGISAVELEQAANALADAKRAVDGYTLENGQVVTDKSYDLQIKNAQYNLDKARENVEEAKVKPPFPVR